MDVDGPRDEIEKFRSMDEYGNRDTCKGRDFTTVLSEPVMFSIASDAGDVASDTESGGGESGLWLNREVACRRCDRGYAGDATEASTTASSSGKGTGEIIQNSITPLICRGPGHQPCDKCYVPDGRFGRNRRCTRACATFDDGSWGPTICSKFCKTARQGDAG